MPDHIDVGVVSPGHKATNWQHEMCHSQKLKVNIWPLKMLILFGEGEETKQKQ